MMAAQNPSISPGSPARHALSTRELDELVMRLLASFAQMADADPGQVLVDGSTFDEIVDDIVRAGGGFKELLGFRWKAKQLPGLPERLAAGLAEQDDLPCRRFEYHYESETVYIDIFSKTLLEQELDAGLCGYLESLIAKLPYQIARLPVVVDDPQVRRLVTLVRTITKNDTAFLEIENKIRTQMDVSFGQAGALPSLVCEVS